MTDGPEAPARPARSRRPATLGDVAREAGVHVSTASRALSSTSAFPIASTTRSRVTEAAQRLRYRPNAVARGLKLADTRSLGLLSPSLRNPVLADIIHGAVARAWERNLVVLLAEDTGDAAAHLAYERLVEEGRIEGLLVASARLDDEMSERLVADGIPCVFVNRRFVGSNRNVSMREEDAGKLAARHLLERGHSHIVHIAGPTDLDTANRRTTGFVAELAAAGITPTITHASYTEAAALEAARVLLGVSPRPSAMFVSNLNQAIGALAGIRISGATAPGQVSLITCDDDPILEHLEVPVTAIRMPLLELGRVAIDALLNQIRGEAPTDRVIETEPVLVVRQSTARL